MKRILICPLNWGLGHATRCIPIIRALIKENVKVIIGAEGRPLALLQKEFPELEFIHFKGVEINYPDDGSMALKMIFSIPKIVTGIIKEHQSLKKIIKEKKIDIVISDNRYGLWNKDIKSIFITHQLNIKAPFAEKTLQRIVSYFIKKYDECWIPDGEDENNLSGALSHTYPLPSTVFYVGALSRFDKKDNHFSGEFKYDVMAILSGPEPQRSIFEKIVLKELERTKLKALVVCGKTEILQKNEILNNMEIVSHLNSNDMHSAIVQSKIIISRSGYSTVMDMAVLGKKCIFIPTPEQTEQEYLAEQFMHKKIAYSQKQQELDLIKALKEAEKYTGFINVDKDGSLEKRLKMLVQL